MSADVKAQLASGLKVKQRLPRMRACDEANEKGKLCYGHLKRSYQLTEELIEVLGRVPEIYRCERCRTWYLPAEGEVARTSVLAW